MVYGKSCNDHLDMHKEYLNSLIIILFCFICFIKKSSIMKSKVVLLINYQYCYNFTNPSLPNLIEIIMNIKYYIFCLLVGFSWLSHGQTNINIDPNKKLQIIDGFGAHQGGDVVNQAWWLNLYYDDMGCSIYRLDLTPKLKAPVSDLSYFSPWFMGSATKSVFNFEDQANPNGPENNRVRTYTGPNDYSRTFGGRQAPIAVMGPDIEKNMNLFSFPNDAAVVEGFKKKAQLGDFKLMGSIWSPVPWVKVSSGNRYPENWWPGPVVNTPWPFIWGGNFSGGRLDVSGTPLAVFNDASVGGTGPTSSLTQFVRSTAAYVLGLQRLYKVPFYSISIQNELNFEVFYSCATYPVSSQYITAVKAIRAEFDKYPELKNIRIMGPEDLLGGDSYGMWEYGGPTHKNLQYLKNIEADPAASKAVDFYCIHGYANDGVSSAGANPRQWDWWVNGWTTSPAQGIPANVKGFTSFNKKSWMTETSGENKDWLYPKTGFPGDGGLGVAIRIHQALTAGRQSAWVYWTFTDSDDAGNVSASGLSNQSSGAVSPKYVGAKHFFKYIRPNSNRVEVVSTGNNAILSSAYFNDSSKTITAVLLNTSSTSQTVQIKLALADMRFNVYSSNENNYWKTSSVDLKSGTINLTMNPYSVTTLNGSLPTTQVNNPKSDVITEMTLSPNPWYHHANIHFNLKHSGLVHIDVLNLYGQVVENIWNEPLSSGNHNIPMKQDLLTPGIYYIKVQMANDMNIVRMIKLNE